MTLVQRVQMIYDPEKQLESERKQLEEQKAQAKVKSTMPAKRDEKQGEYEFMYEYMVLSELSKVDDSILRSKRYSEGRKSLKSELQDQFSGTKDRSNLRDFII